MTNISVCGAILAFGLLVVALLLIRLILPTGGMEGEDGRIWIFTKEGKK